MTVASDLSYACSDGDVLDEIVAGHYGDTLDGKVEAVLAHNPGLAALGAVLNHGTMVMLPVLATDPVVETAQLWG